MLRELNLEKKLFVKVLDYDVYLDEIETWAPLLAYRAIKVKHILNMLNRGLQVEFKNRDDEESLFIFVKQYNIIAKEENEKQKKIVYPVPEVAEEKLMLSLKLKDEIAKKQIEKENPNPFKIKEHTSNINSNKKIIVRKKQQNNNQFKRPKMYQIIKDDTLLDNIYNTSEQELQDIDLSK